MFIKNTTDNISLPDEVERKRLEHQIPVTNYIVQSLSEIYPYIDRTDQTK